jgi:hypothetical protein
MATLVIPTQTGPDVPPTVQTLTLDGISYQFGLRWNARGQAWFLDIADATGASLVNGLRVCNAGMPVNSLVYLQAGLPGGGIFAIANASPTMDATAEDLGDRVLLCYQEAA